MPAPPPKSGSPPGSPEGEPGGLFRPAKDLGSDSPSNAPFGRMDLTESPQAIDLETMQTESFPDGLYLKTSDGSEYIMDPTGRTIILFEKPTEKGFTSVYSPLTPGELKQQLIRLPQEQQKELVESFHLADVVAENPPTSALGSSQHLLDIARILGGQSSIHSARRRAPTKSPDAVGSENPPLPTKPLSECSVGDLRGLSTRQLHELLLRASKYGDRTVKDTDYRTMTRWVVHYLPSTKNAYMHVNVEADVLPNITIVVDPAKTNEYGYQDIELTIPFGSIGASDEVFSYIQDKLQERGLPSIQYGLEKKFRRAMDVFDSPIRDPLDEHDYGDGRIKTGFEKLEVLLAQEVTDLTELNLDFDDVITRLTMIVEDMYHALGKEDVAGDNLPYHFVFDSEEGGSARRFQYHSETDPELAAMTIAWKYNVVLFPFPIRASTLDHRIYKSDDPGFVLPLSETSLELYKKRVVEGFYLGHYRISAARMVWATQYGSPELQAKAFGLDWQHTIDALYEAKHRGTNGERASILNHIIEFFPSDCSRWRQSGFAGYSWKGEDGGEQNFQTMSEWIDAATGSFTELTNYRETGSVNQIM